MIADSLSNAASYLSLHERAARAFGWLREQDYSTLPDGRIDIDGEELFAMVQEYTTVPPDGRRYEGHRRYADIQYIASGTERMLVAPAAELSEDTDYDEEKDIVFYESIRADERASADLTLRGGTFALFMPQDAHMPLLQAGQPGFVRKIVVKILL